MLTQIIFALHAAAYAFTAGRLIALGLARRQIGLLLYLAFRSFWAFGTLVLPRSSPVYFWTYIGCSFIEGPLSLFAVHEALGLVLDEFKGLRSFGRWTMYGGVLVSVIVSSVVTAASWRTDAKSNLYYVLVMNRSVTFALAVVVASLMIFLSHYRLNLSRNRMVSSVAFCIMMMSDATTLYFDARAEHLNVPNVDIAGMAFGTLCMVVWAVMLVREVAAPAQPPEPPRPGNEQRLQQLRDFDALISKVGRKGRPGGGPGTPNLFHPPV